MTAMAKYITTDLFRTQEHEDITWDLILMVEHNEEIKRLLTQAIRQAVAQNPDRKTNPVYSLESYYTFIDRAYRSMPWEIDPTDEYPDLYNRINQSMGCSYFVCDQPLEELADRGYYHNSLVYHEPFRSWWIRFLSVYGEYLNTEESWNEACYQTALDNKDFHLDDGTYEDPSNWKCFNDFFARRLRDPSVRPVHEPDDAMGVVAPADAVPQGVWQIDENGRLAADDQGVIHGIVIKTGVLNEIPVFLGDSAYRDAFAGGTLTHTFLDINDYHRYHFPVTGTIKEVQLIKGDDAPGGAITWVKEQGRYRQFYGGRFGWQSIETRGVIILETETGALAAVAPIGMCQVSSVNFEDSVVPGTHVKKGDPMGCFLFGGSDIVMIFDKKAAFEMTAEPDVHLNTGEAYGRMNG